MKVNLGCGKAYLDGWVNVDADRSVRADVHEDALSFVRGRAEEIDELYMGHVLEHMTPDAASALLAVVASSLPAGATVSAVVPDVPAIFRAYDQGQVTNWDLNVLYVYSYYQPSHHLWCYDVEALAELFRASGFAEVTPIDPLTWPPVYWKTGPWSRWQCGVRGTVPSDRQGAARSLAGTAAKPRSAAALADVAGSLSAPSGSTLVGQLAETMREVEAIRGSRAYALGRRLEDAATRVLPLDSRRRRAARAALDRLPRPTRLLPGHRRLERR